MGHVVVVGSINVDLVVSAARLPRPGETVLGGQFARHFGGKGANQAVAAARAGASVVMVGAVGSEQDGEESLAALRAEGVDVSGVRRVPGPTGVAIIAVAPDGENQIVVAPGANAEVSVEDVTLVGVRAEGGVLLTCLEIPMATAVAAVAVAARSGLQPIVNPAPGQRLPSELLVHGPILTPNKQELLAAAQTNDREDAIARLIEAGARAVVVTLGSSGALLAEGEHRRPVAALTTKVVDGTGAGDAFSGVLAAWLAAGETLEDAVAAANAAAGISVGQSGARGGLPTRMQIEAALRA